MQRVGRSIWIWGSKNRLASSLGMKRIEFAGKHIHKMGIKLEKITYASTVYKIPIEVPDKNPAENEKERAAS